MRKRKINKFYISKKDPKFTIINLDENYELHINRTDEGIVLDVWNSNGNTDEPAFTTYFFDNELMPEEEEKEEEGNFIIRNTSQTAQRINNIGPKQERISPDEVAKALGAEIIKGSQRHTFPPPREMSAEDMEEIVKESIESYKEMKKLTDPMEHMEGKIK